MLFPIPVRLADDNVQTEHLHPKMLYAVAWAALLYAREGRPELIITSGWRDSAPGKRSLHTRWRAVDLRVWDLRDPGQMAEDLGKALGAEFDVLFEYDPERGKNHIHVEYDPV